MIQQHSRLARSARSAPFAPLALALALAACGGTNDSAPTAAVAASATTATAGDASSSAVTTKATVATEDARTFAWMSNPQGSSTATTWDTSYSATGTSYGGDHVPSGYSLVFNDEFNGSSLNRDRWCTRFAYGSGPLPAIIDPECTHNGLGTMDYLNDEQQRYVDHNTRGESMHVVTDGKLKLMGTRTRDDSWVSYEAGLVRAKFEFRADWSRNYYVTARVNMPEVKGTWPCFWLVPTVTADGRSAWPPEIDILEGGLNMVEDRVEMFHMGAKQQNWGGWGPAGVTPPTTFVASNFEPYWGNYMGTSSMRNKWVEIGLEWTANSTCYFVDGQKVLCEDYRWVDNNGNQAPPAQLLLNLAIGGQWAGRHGIDAAAFPTSFDIDHIRVYEKKL